MHQYLNAGIHLITDPGFDVLDGDGVQEVRATRGHVIGVSDLDAQLLDLRREDPCTSEELGEQKSPLI